MERGELEWFGEDGFSRSGSSLFQPILAVLQRAAVERVQMAMWKSSGA